MKRKFLTNLFILLFLNFLVKPFWVLGIDRTVQNVVGAEEYGFYFSLFSFSIILNILLDFGITNFNNRAVARDHGNLASYLSNIVILKFYGRKIQDRVVCLCTDSGLSVNSDRFFCYSIKKKHLFSGPDLILRC